MEYKKPPFGDQKSLAMCHLVGGSPGAAVSRCAFSAEVLKLMPRCSWQHLLRAADCPLGSHWRLALAFAQITRNFMFRIIRFSSYSVETAVSKSVTADVGMLFSVLCANLLLCPLQLDSHFLLPQEEDWTNTVIRKRSKVVWVLPDYGAIGRYSLFQSIDLI